MQLRPLARRRTRREAIVLGASALTGAVLLGCGVRPDGGISEVFSDGDEVGSEPVYNAPDPRPAGREERILLPGAP